MDFISVQKVSKLLQTLNNQGVTILITSHQFDLIASLANQFALLKDGIIEFNYNMEEMKSIAEVKNSQSEQPVKSFVESMLKDENGRETLSWVN